jgi:hypothetical protein
MNRREFIQMSATAAAALALPGLASAEDKTSAGRPEIAVYYFPNYHTGDPRNEKALGKGWSEWDLVKAAKPRFPGHVQPKVPLWGYTNEADPKAMAQKIAAAADNGIDAFIFDWYYYDDGPFLERGLENGFLKAKNNRRLKFALMWANHDWLDIFPANLKQAPKIMRPGTIKPATWDAMTDYIVQKYFKHPSHWVIEGKPYFSIYDIQSFIRSFGSIEEAQAALGRFREKTKTAGFPGLHVNAVMWGQTILPRETVPAQPEQIVKSLGFDSVTSYVWIHHAALKTYPTASNRQIQDDYLQYARRAFDLYGRPYYPNVSVGWDSSPRTDQSGPHENHGYPYTPIVTGNTPEAFKEALTTAKEMLLTRPASERILTVNSWNEWTEGSYLEPDTVNGMKYLEAIRQAFGARSGKRIK